MNEKIISTLSTPDKVVFIDKTGGVFSRAGIALVEYEDGDIDAKFISKEGYICDPAEDSPSLAIIGHEGDEVELSQLHYIFDYSDNILAELNYAEKLLKIRKDNYPDEIEIHLMPDQFEKNGDCLVEILTPDFPHERRLILNLAKEDFGSKLGYGDAEHALIDPIDCYCKFIGKKVNVEVYVDKFLRYTADVDDPRNDEYAKYAKMFEEMYLPRFRRFVKQRVDECYDSPIRENKRQENYHSAIRSLREKYATAYDKDPNLM